MMLMIFDLNDEEMKELGIKSYKLRKSLLRATTGSGGPALTTSPTLAESLQTSLQLEEAQNRFLQISVTYKNKVNREIQVGKKSYSKNL